MAEQTKCFCDLYTDCEINPNRKVNVGHDAVKDEEVFIDGSDFVKRADIICPGTRVFIAQTALNADTVSIKDETVVITVLSSDVSLQCEYFVAANPGM